MKQNLAKTAKFAEMAKNNETQSQKDDNELEKEWQRLEAKLCVLAGDEILQFLQFFIIHQRIREKVSGLYKV